MSKTYGNNYGKVILKDGLVVGRVFVGNIEKSGIVYSLLKDRVGVSDFKQVLISEDFSLASLPEEIWRPHLEVPSSGLVSIATSYPEPKEVVAGE